MPSVHCSVMCQGSQQQHQEVKYWRKQIENLLQIDIEHVFPFYVVCCHGMVVMPEDGYPIKNILVLYSMWVYSEDNFLSQPNSN